MSRQWKISPIYGLGPHGDYYDVVGPGTFRTDLIRGCYATLDDAVLFSCAEDMKSLCSRIINTDCVPTNILREASAILTFMDDLKKQEIDKFRQTELKKILKEKRTTSK